MLFINTPALCKLMFLLAPEHYLLTVRGQGSTTFPTLWQCIHISRQHNKAILEGRCKQQTWAVRLVCDHSPESSQYDRVSHSNMMHLALIQELWVTVICVAGSSQIECYGLYWHITVSCCVPLPLRAGYLGIGESTHAQ